MNLHIGRLTSQTTDCIDCPAYTMMLPIQNAVFLQIAVLDSSLSKVIKSIACKAVDLMRW